MVSVEEIGQPGSGEFFGKPETFYGREELYRRPGLLAKWPKFDEENLRRLLVVLDGTDMWDERRYSYHLRWYEIRMQSRKMFAGTALVVMLILFGIVNVGALFRWLDRFGHPRTGGEAVLASAFYVAVFFGAVLAWRITSYLEGGPRNRFFRLMHKAEIEANRDFLNHGDEEVVRSAGYAGGAAQALFRALRMGRRRWSTPPGISDRALRLSRPLIDLEIISAGPNGGYRTCLRYYRHFLHDFAGLIALRRADLTPALRAYYSVLPGRIGAESQDVAEADNLFLDPMHKHHRWEVVKDFLYPLGSWFSVLVSTVALLVGVLRK
ncbi:hypothetical protein [Amycolatopsis sp. NPDC102389]|uniref:hypothetical protein n=1 Tax=Amycolatopsis sp. NPDC102389 TaxID=3363941 RepID=UPI0037F734F4